MLGGGPVGSFPVASIPDSGVVVSGTIPGTLRLGSIVSITFTASGGTAPYTWFASSLPTGLSINASTGIVSGTSSTIGSYSWSVTATDSTGGTPLTGSTSGTTNVIAFPSFQYDFPNPRGKPWPSDVRTGWIWQTPTALQIPPGAYMNSSKFIAYAVIIPQPNNIVRVYENPLPIPPNKWSFLRKWESESLPLQLAPIIKPVGAQFFPDRFSRKRTVDWTQNSLQTGPTDTGFVYLICYQ